MGLIVRCVAPAEGAMIQGQWDEKFLLAKLLARSNRLSYDYRLWNWDQYIRSRNWITFGLFDEDSAEALAACMPTGDGLMMEFLAVAPTNYRVLGDERACPGAGRLLVAALARICRVRAAERAVLYGHNALDTSLPFYRALQFVEEGSLRDGAREYVALRIPPLDQLIDSHYDHVGTRGAEDASLALQRFEGAS